MADSPSQQRRLSDEYAFPGFSPHPIVRGVFANLTSLPDEQIELICRVLKGERLGAIDGGFDCVRSLHHGHVEAVRMAMDRLGYDTLIDAKASRARDIVVAMVAARIIAPSMRSMAPP